MTTTLSGSLWGMATVALIALPMAPYRPVLFLALVALFSFYLAFSGYRVQRLQGLVSGGSAKPIHWIAAVEFLKFIRKPTKKMFW